MHRVVAVDQGSLAARYGIQPGDLILSINGEPLIDTIDYQALTAVRHVCLVVEKPDGRSREVDILKSPHAPLGLHFAESLICDPRSCANHCVFCFIDQMPKGMRESLYVKDDDWRLSLMMGNFVTLTNVSDKEFERIIKRRASPLYVSVHATDPELRTKMLRQKRAQDLMPRLRRLKDEGLSFHCQIVLCPGINDGEALISTLNDLYELRPSALSVALVPVGLTKYRDGLSDIRLFTAEDARRVLNICETFQQKALKESGTRFVFPADELICLASATLPSADAYEGYPQIENGIGMIRLMEEELLEAARDEELISARDDYPRVIIACGVSIAPYMADWIRRFSPAHANVEMRSLINDFFGHTVTVSGLLVGFDIVNQLKGIQADLLVLPDSMLNADKTLFLDDVSLKDLSHALDMPVIAIPCTGQALYRALNDPWALLNEAALTEEQQ